MNQTRAGVRDVVLVGGGHAHALVLRRWCARAPANARLTVVADRPVAHYSGMVPGLLAGQYALHELEIALSPLAAGAGGTLVVDAARRIDPAARELALESGRRLRFDLLSLDVGSRVQGDDLPGVREHALATRPLADFVRGLEGLVSRALAAAKEARVRVAVVGAGAAGCELAFALDARVRGAGAAPGIVVLDAGRSLLGGASPALARRVGRALRARGIEVRLGARVEAVERGALRLSGEAPLACHAVVWATGPAPPSLLQGSTLPLDARGFLRVGATLQVVGRDDILCAGDAASFDDRPETPKAGVYAVRAAPVLAHNLEALLSGRELRRFTPQRDFLTLLNLGDGRALGAKWGIAVEGRSVFRLKDAIDRRFVAGLRVPA